MKKKFFFVALYIFQEISFFSYCCFQINKLKENMPKQYYFLRLGNFKDPIEYSEDIFCFKRSFHDRKLR